MKFRHSLQLLLVAVAILQLVEVAHAEAFVCRANITTADGRQKAVSGWMHADTAALADQAWRERVHGQHLPRHIASTRCTPVASPPRR